MNYRIADDNDIELLMDIRLEMLRIVNNLTDDYVFSGEIRDESRNYFLSGDQTTVLAFDGEKVTGCATMSYIYMMPTYSHPSGKRGHLMNVYTKEEYRRLGIGRKMVEMLISDAKEKGATEISLDATESGRPLYESLGFVMSNECMVREL